MTEENKTDPTFWTKTLTWLKSRLTEASTWTAIVAIAGYFGYVIDPAQIEYITGIGLSLIALIQVIKKDPITK